MVDAGCPNEHKCLFVASSQNNLRFCSHLEVTLFFKSERLLKIRIEGSWNPKPNRNFRISGT